MLVKWATFASRERFDVLLKDVLLRRWKEFKVFKKTNKPYMREASNPRYIV